MSVLIPGPAGLLVIDAAAIPAWLLPAMVAVALIVLGLLGFILGSWGAAVRRAEMEQRKQEEQDLIREKQAEAERAQRSTDTGVS